MEFIYSYIYYINGPYLLGSGKISGVKIIDKIFPINLNFNYKAN